MVSSSKASELKKLTAGWSGVKVAPYKGGYMISSDNPANQAFIPGTLIKKSG